MSRRVNEGPLLAHLDAARGRRQPGAPADGPHRRAVPAPRLQRHGPAGAAVRAAGDLLRAGKIRYWGLSNFRGWRIAEMVHMARASACRARWCASPTTTCSTACPRSRSCPPEHSRHRRGALQPVARGVLTGKYTPGASRPRARARAGATSASTRPSSARSRWSLRSSCSSTPRPAAPRSPGSPWPGCWRNRAVSSVIAGPRTLAQWQDYLPALDCTVTPEDEALIDSFVAPGHPSTPGFTDPAYPLTPRR
jgi:aryl-alcohol dehydrogenase-like predicted oxidoreductase